MIHDDGVGAGNVQAVFDQRRGHQHIVLPLHELQHRPLEFLFAHLAVRHAHARGGQQALQERGHLENRFHPVVHEEHLALPLHFLHDGD